MSVQPSHPAVSRKSQVFGNYDLVIENSLMRCRVYWARVVGSETESLFTQYTKHTFYEIQYALDGSIVMQIEKNRQICVEQSEFIIIPPDTFHQIVDGDSEGARFIMAFSLEIKDPFFSNLPDELSRLIPYGETPQMRGLIGLLADKCYRDDALRRRLITGYLECFALEFMEAICPLPSRRKEEDESLSENELRVRRLDRVIRDCNGIGLRPRDLAKKFNVSERHLNRIFVEVTGATLKEAINRQKLAKIEELVAATTLSFREISELCDFSDQYTMNKFFKRYNTCSLSDYRALCSSKKK